MRLWLPLMAALAVAGCGGKPPAGAGSKGTIVGRENSAERQTGKPIVAPGDPLVGKVAGVNTSARFVVVTFPVGHLPASEQVMNVYRAGLKVGEVKITGPQLDDNIVGDIVQGEAQPGDEVRRR